MASGETVKHEFVEGDCPVCLRRFTGKCGNCGYDRAARPSLPEEVRRQEREDFARKNRALWPNNEGLSEREIAAALPEEAKPEHTAIHPLKTWPHYFQAVEDGTKRFELRINDRDFQVGDWLWLQEWSPDTRQYSGRETWTRVTYMAQGVFGLPDNVCVMSIEKVSLAARSVEHKGC